VQEPRTLKLLTGIQSGSICVGSAAGAVKERLGALGKAFPWSPGCFEWPCVDVPSPAANALADDDGRHRRAALAGFAINAFIAWGVAR